MGANDRKRQNGMAELYNNLIDIIHKFKQRNKVVILLTPNPSTHQNETRPNRIFHTEDVTNVITRVAEKESIFLIDNYNYIQEYLFIKGMKIDDIIYGENCINDGLHPSDFVQYLIYRYLLRGIGLSNSVP